MGCCLRKSKDRVIEVKPAAGKEKQRPDYGHIHHSHEPAKGATAASTAPASADANKAMLEERNKQLMGESKDGQVTGIITDAAAVDGVPLEVEPPLRKNSNKKNQDREYDDNHLSAARKIEAVYRGGRDREHVRDVYRTHSSQEKLRHPTELSLKYAEEWSSWPDVSEDLRYYVRDCTSRKVLQQLGYKDSNNWRHPFEECAYSVLWETRNEVSSLPAAVQKQMALVRHYMDPAPDEAPKSASTYNSYGYGGSRRKQEQYIIGQFDCVAVPVRADYDIGFQPIPAGRSVSPISFDAETTGTAPPLAVPETPPVLESNHTASHATSPGSHKEHAGHKSTAGHGGEEPRSDHMAVAVAPEAPPDCDGPDGFAGWFWVVHSAAPNIGERANADDFHEYSKEEAHSGGSYGGYSGYSGGTYSGGTYGTYHTSYQSGAVHGTLIDSRGLVQPCWKGRYGQRRLDEDLYVKDMARLWRNSLLAFSRLEVEDAILFPFGMGAFLRHLGQNDDRYNDEKTMHRLRRRVAEQLMDAIIELCVGEESGGARSSKRSSDAKKKQQKAKGKPPAKLHPERVHLCLMVSNAEGVENHNSFVEAAADRAKGCPKLADVLRLSLNVDCLQLAHNIACSQWQQGLPKVGILNGANRKLVGNHWFQNGAKSAIDENMHRRSSSMARSSLLLNMNTEPRTRKPFQLAKHVVTWGGQVIATKDGSVLAGGIVEAERVKAPAPHMQGAGHGHTSGHGHHYGGGSEYVTNSAHYYEDDDECCCCCCSRRKPRGKGGGKSHHTTTAAIPQQSGVATAAKSAGTGTAAKTGTGATANSATHPSATGAAASKAKQPKTKPGWA